MPVPLEAVQQAQASVEASLKPADLRAVAVELEKTLALFGAPDNWDDIAETYLEAFDGVPLDLVKEACKAARLRCKWFPKPAELLAPINGELTRRRDVRRRLSTAAMRAQPAGCADEALPPADADPARTAGIVAQSIRHMGDRP